MAARPYWRGQIRLALVSIPVEIFSATKSGAAVAFHQIYEPTGQRIKYEKTVPGIGPVDVDKIIKGFEYEKGEYVLLDDKEEQRLVVRFVSGKVYTYDDVPPEIAEGFRAAASKGTYFNDVIRDRFPFARSRSRGR